MTVFVIAWVSGARSGSLSRRKACHSETDVYPKMRSAVKQPLVLPNNCCLLKSKKTSQSTGIQLSVTGLVERIFVYVPNVVTYTSPSLEGIGDSRSSKSLPRFGKCKRCQLQVLLVKTWCVNVSKHPEHSVNPQRNSTNWLSFDMLIRIFDQVRFSL